MSEDYQAFNQMKFSSLNVTTQTTISIFKLIPIVQKEANAMNYTKMEIQISSASLELVGLGQYGRKLKSVT